MNLVHIGLLQVGVTALPAHGIEDHEKHEHAETGSADPVDKWVAEEEVFDDCVALA